MPTEEITIIVEVLAGKDNAAFTKLCDVSKSHHQFIQDSIKQPILTTQPSADCEEVIQEVVEVSVNTVQRLLTWQWSIFGQV